MLFASGSIACELTEDYIKLETEVQKLSVKDYNACRKATHDAKFWREMALCEEKR